MKMREPTPPKYNCPTCGSTCTVGGNGTTHFYVPCITLEDHEQLMNEAADRIFKKEVEISRLTQELITARTAE